MCTFATSFFWQHVWVTDTDKERIEYAQSEPMWNSKAAFLIQLIVFDGLAIPHLENERVTKYDWDSSKHASMHLIGIEPTLEMSTRLRAVDPELVSQLAASAAAHRIAVDARVRAQESWNAAAMTHISLDRDREILTRRMRELIEYWGAPESERDIPAMQRILQSVTDPIQRSATPAMSQEDEDEVEVEVEMQAAVAVLSSMHKRRRSGRAHASSARLD